MSPLSWKHRLSFFLTFFTAPSFFIQAAGIDDIQGFALMYLRKFGIILKRGDDNA